MTEEEKDQEQIDEILDKPMKVEITNPPKELEIKNPTSKDTEDPWEHGITEEQIKEYQEDINNA